MVELGGAHIYICVCVCVFYYFIFGPPLSKILSPLPLQFYIDFIIIVFALVLKKHKAPNFSNQPPNTLTSVYESLCKNTYVL